MQVGNSKCPFNYQGFRVTWVAQLVDRPSLDFGSGQDHGVVG